ncbi:MAG: radical SAM protein [Deltaproteobacteria bacterium]|nr:radical SAM protein [Deltaproteobacteria bacterium]
MLSACRFFLVLPADRPAHEAPLTESARLLLNAARIQAQGFLCRTVEVLAVNIRDRRIWHLDHRRRPPVSGCLPRYYLFMNVGCILSDAPPFAELLKKARQSRAAWIGEKSSNETHAFAIFFRFPVPGIFTLTKCFRPFWEVMGRLTACAIDGANDRTSISRMEVIPPGPASVENSPAMGHVKAFRSRRWGNAPSYLNTAIKEIVSKPQYPYRIERNPLRMSQALLAQRDASQVPWIFNTLVNEIEYRQGRITPQSFPPEIHLSLTGRCNLECRFCSYTHDISRFDVVDPKEIARLDILGNVQTFRLNSGLGEPTMNRHLPEIIDTLSHRFPHLSMNFFTNGLLLDRPGLIQALVGKVRWMNVSLNAATHETWEAVCRNNQFDRVCQNLRQLHGAKRMTGWLWPMVHGSMVVTRANMADLPQMPGLCRELGVDRFTLFPFFALGYKGAEKYGAEMTLEACRGTFDALYEETLRKALDHQITLEIPPQRQHARTAFGLEVRAVNDFARIESNEWPLGRLLTGLDFDRPPEAYCHFLWRYAAIGSTHNAGHSPHETHYLYPCIGPLSGVDLSRHTAFRFPDEKGFLKLWQNPVFTSLRKAQHQEGVCEVCDICRRKNTRDPEGFALLERLVAEFASGYSR